MQFLVPLHVSEKVDNSSTEDHQHKKYIIWLRNLKISIWEVQTITIS